MKYILIFFLFTFATITLSAQDDSTAQNNGKMKTLFGSGELRSGGYGAPEIKFSPVAGDMGIWVGGRGGWILNSTFAIGGGGYGLVTSHEVKNYFVNNDTAAYLRAGYGGLILTYINSSDDVIHFTVNALIGAGGASYTKSYNSMMSDNYHNGNYSYENSAFFVFEPGIGVELNVVKFFRIELGASYRMISGLELTRTSNKDLSGFSANMAFKFGKF